MNALAKLLGRATEPLEPLTDGPLLAECGPATEAPREADIAFDRAQQEKARELGAKRMGALGLEWD